MRSKAVLLLAACMAGGASGPVATAPVARAAPPPAYDVRVLPASALVLRAAADASGIYAYLYDAEHEARQLVRRRPGGAIDVLAVAPRIEQLALDADRVYWVGQDGVQAVPKHGGPVETLAGRDVSLVAGAPDASRWAIAVRGDDVFFSLDDGIGRVGAGGTGGAGGGPAQLLAGGTNATLVGVDEAEVSWLEAGHDGTWDLVATPRRGGPARRVLAALPSVVAMVLDDDAIYWLAATDRPGVGTIHRAARGSAEAGPITTIADDVPTYYEHVLAIAGKALVWLEYPNGLHGPMRLRAVPVTGGAPVTLAEPFPPASRILVDERRIYWAGEGIGAIERPAP